MRWEDYRQSDNVEDARGGRVGRAAGGVGIGGLILMGVLYFAFGIDPRVLMESGLVGGGQPRQEQVETRPADPNDRIARFVSAVLASTEDTWDAVFRDAGRQYERPRLRMFAGGTESGCGFAQSAMGPFYCPQDQRIYLDTTFFDELARRFGAPGEGASAYVIAHEVGHHVQNLRGILPRVQQEQRRLSQEDANALQVRVELQADCFAGVWAHRSRRVGLVDDADIQSALRAASAIGDDTIQRRSQGHVVPESFTHGSSEQRMRWFMTGARSGDPAACNTFEQRRS
jgi:hypothetical protein